MIVPGLLFWDPDLDRFDRLPLGNFFSVSRDSIISIDKSVKLSAFVL